MFLILIGWQVAKNTEKNKKKKENLIQLPLNRIGNTQRDFNQGSTFDGQN